MRRRTALLLGALAALGIGAAAYLARGSALGSRGEAELTLATAQERGSRERGVERALPAALEPPRETVEAPGEPARPTPAAEASAGDIPLVDTVGDQSTWPAEYADKQLDTLVADEKRLRAENEAELDAEIEKRFAEGRVETYRQGEQPKSRLIVGKLVGRGDETHIRYVEMDPRLEPQFWRKDRKANWLHEELLRRQKAGR